MTPNSRWSCKPSLGPDGSTCSIKYSFADVVSIEALNIGELMSFGNDTIAPAPTPPPNSTTSGKGNHVVRLHLLYKPSVMHRADQIRAGNPIPQDST